MAFVVAEDDVPRRVGCVGAGNHIFRGAQVIIPLLTVTIILGRHLMALMRRVFPGLKTAHLLFLGNINPDLEHNHAGFREAGLVVVDLGISAGPFGVGGKALDPFDHHAAIPGAVKDGKVSRGGRLIPKAPQVVAGFFFLGRRGYRVDLIVRDIHQPAETANRTALAGGIGALEGEDGAQALGGGEAGESTETGL